MKKGRVQALKKIFFEKIVVRVRVRDDECGLRPKKPMLEENHDAGGMVS